MNPLQDHPAVQDDDGFRPVASVNAGESFAGGADMPHLPSPELIICVFSWEQYPVRYEVVEDMHK